jgi:RNA polymerase sigma-54 factor
MSAMRLELGNQMRMEQKMLLAPKMIQSMEILQLPAMELLQRIDIELSKNPVLEAEYSDPDAVEADNSDQVPDKNYDERDLVVDNNDGADDFNRLESLDDGFKDAVNQTAPIRETRNVNQDDDPKYEAIQNTADTHISLYEHLVRQWSVTTEDEKLLEAGFAILEQIDNKGYFAGSLDELRGYENEPLEMETCEKALEMIQQLEPAGVGARDIPECLKIQIDNQDEPQRFETARRIVTECYELLLSNRRGDIAKKLNKKPEEIADAIKQLGRFNIAPGDKFSQGPNLAIKPDIIVEKNEDGVYEPRLADTNLPDLYINSYYSRMASDKTVDGKTKNYLKRNINSANWLIEAIMQRKQTLMKVATAVVNRQQEFFEKGIMYLKPLTMVAIAEEIEMHVSTVSRAVADKYVQCSRGIIPLHDFFSTAQKQFDGSSQSTDSIKAVIKEIIDNEDKSKPLGDEKIMKKLEQKGIKIARRTIVKYRQQMNIPTAKMRKLY